MYHSPTGAHTRPNMVNFLINYENVVCPIKRVSYENYEMRTKITPLTVRQAEERQIRYNTINNSYDEGKI